MIHNYFIWATFYARLNLLWIGATMGDYSIRSKFFIITTLACLASAGMSYADADRDAVSPSVQLGALETQPVQAINQPNLISQDTFDVFVPKKQTLSTSFDYTVWDNALENRVIQMGPSLRRFAKRTRQPLGSRVVISSRNSPYRLEGSRFTFNYISDSYVASLNAYKDDLIRLANEYDIQSFSRNEQLAFWINLHNVVLIEAIAQKHPTTNPSDLIFGQDMLPLHEAKLMTIKDVPLSLRNIRENIVYENWNTPNVIYGFFRGDIGGPGLMPFAVTAENLEYVLATHALEYITSLRGFHTTKKYRKISQLYNEARPYYFSNWPQDLESHLKGYLQNHELLSQVQENKPISFIEYETIIADLWGGNNSLGSAHVTNWRLDKRGGLVRSGLMAWTPPVLIERKKKIKELGAKGLLKRNYTIIIEELETEDKTVP